MTLVNCGKSKTENEDFFTSNNWNLTKMLFRAILSQNLIHDKATKIYSCTATQANNNRRLNEQTTFHSYHNLSHSEYCSKNQKIYQEQLRRKQWFVLCIQTFWKKYDMKRWQFYSVYTKLTLSTVACTVWSLPYRCPSQKLDTVKITVLFLFSVHSPNCYLNWSRTSTICAAKATEWLLWRSDWRRLTTNFTGQCAAHHPSALSAAVAPARLCLQL